MSASTLLRDHGEIMIAPNGSLVTPIEERVSPSAWMLAQHYGGRVVPWFFSYDGLEGATGARYKPLQLLLGRLTAPLGTIHCRRGVEPMISGCPLIPATVKDSALLFSSTTGSRQHKADVVTAEAKGVLEHQPFGA